MADLARQRGCYGMWVLADDDDEAAHATYHSAGGDQETRPVLVSWSFPPADGSASGAGAD